MNKRVITRIKGGLGNQLFCYAAARRLALANNAELIIDNITGFARDKKFRRQYMLDKFQITARKATPAERLEPFERYRRGVMKWWTRKKPFAERQYLEQEGSDFDERLIALKVTGILYLDGLWQSEDYFKDIESTIREDLRIIPPEDEENLIMAREICKSNSVAVHMRWFDAPGSTSLYNVSPAYYKRAIAFLDKKLESPRYFLFSNSTEASRVKLALPKGRVTFVSYNQGDENSYADLWLMSQCRHFITANSTFSWWGAWLGGHTKKIVVTPDMKIYDKKTWDFKGLIPGEWLKI